MKTQKVYRRPSSAQLVPLFLISLIFILVAAAIVRIEKISAEFDTDCQILPVLEDCPPRLVQI